MKVVPSDCFDDLTVAVERLQSLKAKPDGESGGDPLSLFDALCDVYQASERLVHPMPASPSGTD